MQKILVLLALLFFVFFILREESHVSETAILSGVEARPFEKVGASYVLVNQDDPIAKNGMDFYLNQVPEYSYEWESKHILKGTGNGTVEYAAFSTDGRQLRLDADCELRTGEFATYLILDEGRFPCVLILPEDEATFSLRFHFK